MKSKIFILLMLIFVLSSVTMAEVVTSDGVLDSQETAENLQKLGVFKGSDSGFELDRSPTRLEGMIMFIRLLGKESDAVEYRGTHPFTDVPKWANGYVSWAYENGYTNGVSEDKFGLDEMNSKSYMTLMLRALGYDDKKGDFSWNTSLSFAKSKDLINSVELQSYGNESFTRDYVSKISYKMLSSKQKDGLLLIDKLVKDKSIDEKLAMELNLVESDGRIELEIYTVKTDDGYLTTFNLEDIRIGLSSEKIMIRKESSNAWTSPHTKEQLFSKTEINEEFTNMMKQYISNKNVKDSKYLYSMKNDEYGNVYDIALLLSDKGVEAIIEFPPFEYDKEYYARVYIYTEEEYNKITKVANDDINNYVNQIVELKSSDFLKDTEGLTNEGEYYVYERENKLTDLGVVYYNRSTGSIGNDAIKREIRRDYLNGDFFKVKYNNATTIQFSDGEENLILFYNKELRPIAYIIAKDFEEGNLLKRPQITFKGIDKDEFDENKFELILKKDDVEIFRIKNYTITDGNGSGNVLGSNNFIEVEDTLIYTGVPIVDRGYEISVEGQYEIIKAELVDIE